MWMSASPGGERMGQDGCLPLPWFHALTQLGSRHCLGNEMKGPEQLRDESWRSREDGSGGQWCGPGRALTPDRWRELERPNRPEPSEHQGILLVFPQWEPSIGEIGNRETENWKPLPSMTRAKLSNDNGWIFLRSPFSTLGSRRLPLLCSAHPPLQMHALDRIVRSPLSPHTSSLPQAPSSVGTSELLSGCCCPLVIIPPSGPSCVFVQTGVLQGPPARLPASSWPAPGSPPTQRPDLQHLLWVLVSFPQSSVSSPSL